LNMSDSSSQEIDEVPQVMCSLFTNTLIVETGDWTSIGDNPRSGKYGRLCGLWQHEERGRGAQLLKSSL
jgi:hypothetical protein